MIGRTVRGLVAATVLVAAVSSAAEAQMSSTPRFGVNAGVAMATGDVGDAVGLGIHAGAHFGMPFGTSAMWGWRANFDYGMYGGEDGGNDLTIMGGVANVIMNVQTESAWKPYLLAGIGFYNWDAEVVDDSEMAFNIGAGYNFTMGSANWFAEIRYLSIQTDPDAINTIPIVIGLRF